MKALSFHWSTFLDVLLLCCRWIAFLEEVLRRSVQDLIFLGQDLRILRAPNEKLLLQLHIWCIPSYHTIGVFLSGDLWVDQVLEIVLVSHYANLILSWLLPQKRSERFNLTEGRGLGHDRSFIGRQLLPKAFMWLLMSLRVLIHAIKLLLFISQRLLKHKLLSLINHLRFCLLIIALTNQLGGATAAELL